MSRSLALNSLTCLVLAAIGCSSNYESCPMPRAERACPCQSGSDGEQRCLPEMVWGECDCSEGAPADGGMASPAGSAAAGRAGGNSGGAGASAAAGAGAGGGAAGTGAGGGNMTDGGAGMGGSAGGAAGASGMGGAAGAASDKPAYGACTVATAADDCGSGATCTVTPFLPEDVSVCAPACTSAGQCPTLDGDFEAELECTGGRCRYECGTLIEPLSCPSGMVCASDDITGLTPAFCHDADGE